MAAAAGGFHTTAGNRVRPLPLCLNLMPRFQARASLYKSYPGIVSQRCRLTELRCIADILPVRVQVVTKGKLGRFAVARTRLSSGQPKSCASRGGPSRRRHVGQDQKLARPRPPGACLAQAACLLLFVTVPQPTGRTKCSVRRYRKGDAEGRFACVCRRGPSTSLLSFCSEMA